MTSRHTNQGTGTTGTHKAEEATMFQVLCPCGCGTKVEARDKGFKATRVTVECCERSLLGSVNMPKSWAYAEAVPETGLRHKDGLVVF